MRTFLPYQMRRFAAHRFGLCVFAGGLVLGSASAGAQGEPDEQKPATAPVVRPENPFLRKRPPARRVTLTVQDSTIEYVLQQLAELAQLSMTLPQGDVRLLGRIDLSVANTPVVDAMAIALRGTGLQASLTDDWSAIEVHPATSTPREVNPQLIAVKTADTMPTGVVRLDTVIRTPRTFGRPGATVLAGVVTTATGTQRQLEIGTSIVSVNVDSIMGIAPISSVTDLLEGRVPGLTVQRTSGTPGDPARIRVRGMGSVAVYNDPIIVIDGARMYARQSDRRNLNAGGFINYAGQRTSQYSTPSALDQIEPSTIERIEVLKGPSASALYGSDAANGVILITTKRGRPGDTRWMLTGEQGIAYIPGNKYDAQHTPFETGRNSAVALTLSGGNPAIQYAYTAGIRKQHGVLKLPEVERQRYRDVNGVQPPSWMRSPDHLDAIGGNGQVTIQANDHVNIALTNLMNSQTQERTSLSNGLSGVLGQLNGDGSGEGSSDSIRLRNYYERVSTQSRNLVMSLQIRYVPVEYIPITAIFGLGRLTREDKNSMTRGIIQSPDSTGFYGSGNGTATERTVSVNSVIPLMNIFSIGIGGNMQRGTVSDLRGSFRNIPLGVTVPSSGDVIEFTAPEDSWSLIGWFVEPKIAVTPRLFVTPGIRIDNTALSGNPARYSSYPKISVSWIASEEPFFPWEDLFSTLRFRAAMGYAGVPPTSSDQLDQQRLRAMSASLARGQPQLFVFPEMPLERSMEVEAGVDAEAWQKRLRMDLTYFRKTRKNAIIDNSLASSLPDVLPTRRFGDLRYSGFEFGLDADIIRTRTIRWQSGITLTRNVSELTQVHQPGYGKFNLGPTYGIAAFPPEARNPNYQMAINSGLTLFNGSVSIFTSFTYVDGLIQRNLAGVTLFPDSTSSLADLAYGDAEVVHAFRWQTLSVNYRVPDRVNRLLRVGSLDLALQGANLGLQTNYSGLDPNVSGLVTGNATFDTGQVPQPRVWQVRVTVRR